MSWNDFLKVEEDFCGLLLMDSMSTGQPIISKPQPKYKRVKYVLADESDKAYFLRVFDADNEYLDYFPKSRVIINNVGDQDIINPDMTVKEDTCLIDVWILDKKKPRTGTLVGEQYL